MEQLTSTAWPSSRSKPTTQMQWSQAEKRSHGSRSCSGGSPSPGPSAGISSAGETLKSSSSCGSSASSVCSDISSDPCEAILENQKYQSQYFAWLLTVTPGFTHRKRSEAYAANTKTHSGPRLRFLRRRRWGPRIPGNVLSCSENSQILI